MAVLNMKQTLEFDVTCPLCFHSGSSCRLPGPLGFAYQLCDQCRLIHMEKHHLPDAAAEKARYLTHQNGVEFPGYVDFLYRAITPALQYFKEGMLGLDYGCGPAPTLSLLLGNEGFDCRNYDPFFYPDFPGDQFDFVFATESAEHFIQPGEEFLKIHNLLKTDGVLTIMTELWEKPEQFSDWYYAKDFTHVSFYHADTIQTICDLFGFKPLHLDQSRVSVIRKL